jgi:peptidoglycan/xylan/chitin deacetylase (PgdA/CDA1 family)
MTHHSHQSYSFIGAGAVIVLCIIAFSTAHSAQTQKRSVAVTFDDLPATHGDLVKYEYVTANLLARLKAEEVPAIGFVNESKLFVLGEIDRRTALLGKWLDAGHDLGNHSFSHIAIDRATFEEYTADVIRGETVTRMLAEAKGKRLRYYRHTQLRTGPTEEFRKRLNDFLTARGYTVAPVTVDNNEYLYALAYANAKAKGDEVMMDRIVGSYVDYMEGIFTHFETISRSLLGYEVSQTLLLHANELNADHFDKLAAMLHRRGYIFVTLDEALKDPAYKLPEAPSRRGLSWLHRWTLAKGRPIDEEPSEPDWIRQAARRQ